MIAKTWRLAVAPMLALCWAATGRAAHAQSARVQLEQGQEAYDFAEFERAVPLLSAGLNPAGGPQDSLWVSGVHKLAHALIDLGRAPVATVWLRWALRLRPDLVVDDVNFPPPLVDAFSQAGDFVRGSALDPGVVRLTWEWPPAAQEGGSGQVLIRTGTVSVNGRIEGGEFLSAGSPRSVSPGSYTILATAEGHLPARVTIEVLPGVTTALAFNLAPAAAGFLYVASRPWGTVYLDGEPIGYSTIAAHRLVAGPHRVRIERQGQLAFDTTIAVVQNQRVRLAAIATGLSPGEAAVAPGTIDQRLARALAALDSSETERGAQLLRDLLASAPRDTPLPLWVRAHVHLAAASWALGLRDSAAARFREAVRLNPFAVLDPEIFNPDLVALYGSVRRSTPAVGLRVARDTTLKPDADVVLVALGVGEPGDVTLRFRRTSPPGPDTVLASVRIETVRTLPFAPLRADGMPWEPGDYELVALVAGASGSDTALVSLRLTGMPVDTAPHEPPPSATLLRPEARKGPPAASSALLGLTFGAAAAAIPLSLANKELDNRMLDHVVPVSASVIVAGVAGIFLGRKDVPIPENIAYNRTLRTSWEERNRAIAAANARLWRFAPLRLQVLREP